MSTFLNPYHITVLTNVGITLIAALGLNIISGIIGQTSLGHAAFFGIGAYCSAMLTTQLSLTFWQALPISIVVTWVFGLMLSFTVLRFKDDFLAIVTMGVGMINLKGAVLLAEQAMERWKMSNRQIREVKTILCNPLPDEADEWSDPEVREFMVRAGADFVDDIVDLAVACGASEPGQGLPAGKGRILHRRFREQRERHFALGLGDLAVDGEDVIRLTGLERGPIVGEILREVENVVAAIERKGYTARTVPGGQRVAICVLHNHGSVDAAPFLALSGVIIS